MLQICKRFGCQQALGIGKTESCGTGFMGSWECWKAQDGMCKAAWFSHERQYFVDVELGGDFQDLLVSFILGFSLLRSCEAWNF
jgi:hypothetical protein